MRTAATQVMLDRGEPLRAIALRELLVEDSRGIEGQVLASILVSVDEDAFEAAALRLKNHPERSTSVGLNARAVLAMETARLYPAIRWWAEAFSLLVEALESCQGAECGVILANRVVVLEQLGLRCGESLGLNTDFKEESKQTSELAQACIESSAMSELDAQRLKREAYLQHLRLEISSQGSDGGSKTVQTQTLLSNGWDALARLELLPPTDTLGRRASAQEALRVFEQLSTNEVLVAQLMLAEVDFQEGDNRKAEKVAARVARHADLHGQTRLEAKARRLHAFTADLQEESSQAIESYEAAIRLFDSFGDWAQSCELTSYLGRTYRKLGQVQRYRSSQARVLECLKAGGLTPIARISLSRLLIEELVSRKSHELARLVAADTLTRNRRLGKSLVLVSLLELLRVDLLTETPISTEELQLALDDQLALEDEGSSTRRFWEARRDLLEGISKVEESPKDAVVALERATKTLRSEGVGTDLLLAERHLAKAHQRIRRADIALVSLERAAVRLLEYGSDLSLPLEQVRLAAERALLDDLVATAWSIDPALALGWVRRLASLQPSEHLAQEPLATNGHEIVVYRVLPGRVLVWRLSQTGPTSSSTEIRRTRFEELVAGQLASLASGNLRSRESRLLWDLFLEDRPPEAPTVVFVADPGVATPQFAAMEAPDASLLVERANVAVSVTGVYSVDSLDLATSSALVLAAPTLDASYSSLASLQWSAEESEFFEHLVGDLTLRVADEASVSYLLKPKVAYDVVHLAAHSFPIADVDGPAVLLAPDEEFSDGVVSVADVLRSGNRSRLIFLGSCQSGVFDTRTPLSLARAFLTVGTSAVIYTLTPVLDRDASEFATAFYSDLTSSNSSVASISSVQRQAVAASRDSKLRQSEAARFLLYQIAER